MRYCGVNCLYIAVVCQFVFAPLVSAKETGNPQKNDFDDSEKLLYKPMDKTDWVDYGDMFTYDPATKTNREPKLKTAVEKVIKRKKEAQENAEILESLSSHCDQVEQKLRECEASKRSICDCARNDHCGKLSYLIVRRLIMKLSKLIDNQYNSGSKIGLTVHLDDYFFDLPLDFSNLTDCDYLVQINPLIDRLMSSVELSRPMSNNISEVDLYIYGATVIAILLVIWFYFEMSTRTRVLTIFSVFLIVAYLVEYAQLYQTNIANAKEAINRLKLKCTQQDDPGWSGWLNSLLPAMNFKNPKIECQDYYTAMYVAPFLQTNPIQPIFSILTKTFLYSIKLFADASGASIASFFSHIPALYFIPILIAVVVLFVHAMKYFFKYRHSPRVILPKQKNIFIDKETRPSLKFNETIREETQPKLERRRAKTTLVKCRSLGNIRDLCL